MALVWITVAGGFLTVPAHFWYRASRGDYPVDGDSIGIPIFVYWLLFYPFEFEALRGRGYYRGGDSLFSRSYRRPGKAFISTLGTFAASLWSVTLVMDSIGAKMPFSAIFYSFRIYAFLLLRCALMRSYDDEPYFRD